MKLRRRDDRGYIAVLAAVLVPVMFALSAFTIDVGNWYVVGQQVQRAADAAALAGVTYMPGDFASAQTQALATAAANGFTPGADTTIVVAPVTGNPSELQVTITQVVTNTFGQLLNDPTETISRTAIANYQAPLPMGSPCNEFGNGPDPVVGAVAQRSAACAQAGQFWANVGSPESPKSNGDAYQDDNCAASAAGTDDCSGGTNSDYSANGYFYSIKISQPITGLTVQAFDPAFVSVGDLCTANFGSGSTAASLAKNQYNYNPATSAASATYLEDAQLYGSGQSNAYCTGDMLYTQTGQAPDTTYTIRQPVATSSPWDPTSYPAISGCTSRFAGFSGNLYTALNQWQQTNGVVQYSGGKPVAAATGSTGYQPQVASEFRQWVTLCTIPGTIEPGTYFIQVQTNGAGDNPQGDGHNRFALRAFTSSPANNTAIAISGYTDMAIYADLPSAQTSFYLTQVPPGAAGQILDVRLFDIGDSTTPGQITILPPVDSGLGTFSGCVGTGPASGALTNCSLTANSTFNGKWESVEIPIPVGYTCQLAASSGCWITLTYNYGGGQPSDTTSWQASLEGTPVRLTK